MYQVVGYYVTREQRCLQVASAKSALCWLAKIIITTQIINKVAGKRWIDGGCCVEWGSLKCGLCVALWLYTACSHYADGFGCQLSGLCVPTRYVCDGGNECGDWSDELNCRESRPDFSRSLIGNGSVPIQLALCRFPRQAISNAEI